MDISIRRILDVLEQSLPLALQESYDHSGIQVGNPKGLATGVLLAVDITEAVLEEAVSCGCNLIIAHHPLLFKSIKEITGANYIQRCVQYAIKQDLTIYAAHTNADNAGKGLNVLLAEKFALQAVRPLQPMSDMLLKLVCYVPQAHAERLRRSLWDAGAGHIGAYDRCSYNLEGHGTFRAGSSAHPFVGETGKLHTEAEVQVSVILPRYLQHRVEQALIQNHPYEEPTYDFVPLANQWQQAGAGIVGDLPEAINPTLFLQRVKAIFGAQTISYSECMTEKIKRVAICGGAGAFLWREARRAGADAFITGEAKYNDYFDVEGHPMLVTVGHYESELAATELFSRIISDKFPNFDVHLSNICANPVHYL